MISNKRRRKLLSEINVTPFVDVVLVLLIIFMITAPFLNSIDVNLPEVTSSPLDLKEDKPVVITINSKGQIYLDDTPINSKALDNALTKYKNKETQIFIKGDKKATYQDIMTVMSVVAQKGFKNISLITENQL